MALPAFDTHAYVKRLKEAGFNEQQAEAQAELQAQVLSSLVTEKLATKEDMIRLEMRLENLIKEENSDLRNDMLRLESSTKKEISDLSNETKQEFIRITGKFTQLNWMISFLLAGVMTILFKLFLHG